MCDLQKVILAALGLLMLLVFIVGAVLRHHIGGFIENVAREAREEEERLAREEEERLEREACEPETESKSNDETEV